MKVLDLFSGIGGFSLGLERAGMETIAFCEIEEYPRRVLKKHWPDIPIYEDVRNVTKERLDADGIFPDVITGGFPCQDISLAGKQAGIGEGTRSGLWAECARILGEFRPRYAIFENVTALLSGERGKWFERVLWDISQVGYDAEWHCIPASELGAQHIRDRVWILAYPSSELDGEQYLDAEKRDNLQTTIYPNTNGFGLQRVDTRPWKASGENGASARGETGRASIAGTITNTRCWQQELSRQIRRVRRETEVSRNGYWETTSEPFVSRGNHGISKRMDRIRAIGNAVVPQIPEIIGRAIMEVECANNCRQ